MGQEKENNKSGSGSLRERMPETAAFVDAMRQAFGVDEINGQIRKGMAGDPVFWASENGHEIGTPFNGGNGR